MSERDESVYLRHILDSIERIETYLDDVSEDEFRSDPLLQDAVVRRLEIIGEATKQPPASTRSPSCSAAPEPDSRGRVSHYVT